MAIKATITIEARVKVPIEKAWEYWNDSRHVKLWNSASSDWHTTKAENELKAGGKFLYRMEAKDGSFGFDFGGIYDVIEPPKLLAYTLGDGRKVEVNFQEEQESTNIVETFQAEDTNSIERQREGWQAILNNFKRYAEGLKD